MCDCDTRYQLVHDGMSHKRNVARSPVSQNMMRLRERELSGGLPGPSTHKTTKRKQSQQSFDDLHDALYGSLSRRLGVACVLPGQVGDTSRAMPGRPQRVDRVTGHQGCVNTVEWASSYGGEDVLVSGSDDCQVLLWRWDLPSLDSLANSDKLQSKVFAKSLDEKTDLWSKAVVENYPHLRQDRAWRMSLRAHLRTGHVRNIFSAKAVPHSNAEQIVSTGMDGEVRLTFTERQQQTSEVGRLLASFEHFLFKIYFLPHSPSTFLTTHQDGTVRIFDLRAHKGLQDASAKYERRAITEDDTKHLLFRLHAEQRDDGFTAFRNASDGPSNTMSFAADGFRVAVGGGDPFVRVLDLRLIAQHDQVSAARGADADLHDRLTNTKIIGRICPEPVLDRPTTPFSRCFVTSVDWSGNYSAAGDFRNGHPAATRNLLGGGDLLINYSNADVYLVNSEEALARYSSRFDAPLEEGDNSSERMHDFSYKGYSQCYRGRRNVQTFLKEAMFICGGRYVATGSDCGNLFMWDRQTAELVQVFKADDSIVNAVAPHPSLPVIAVSGIDSSIKIVAPVNHSRYLHMKEPESEVQHDDLYSRRARQVVKRHLEAEQRPDSDSDEEGGIPVARLFALLQQLQAARAQAAADAGGTQQRESDSSGEDSEDDEGDSDDDDEDLGFAARVRRAVRRGARIREIANDQFRQGHVAEAHESYSEIVNDLDYILGQGDQDSAAGKQLLRSKMLAVQNRAACSLRLRQFQDVVSDCTFVLETADSMGMAPPSKAHFRRGVAHMRLGNYVEARENLLSAQGQEGFENDASIVQALAELDRLEAGSEQDTAAASSV